MTDYHPLIARAVEGLGKSTGEARRGLYERARTALVTQLRSVEPALSESDITKERLALEEAIRKVEADAARKSRTEPREARQPMPPQRDRPVSSVPRRSTEAKPKNAADNSQAEADRPAPPPTARERLLGARAPALNPDGIKSSRDTVSDLDERAAAKSTPSSREARDSYGATPQHGLPDDEPTLRGFEPQYEAEELSSPPYARRNRDQEHADDLDAAAAALAPSRQPPYATLPEETPEPRRPARSYRGLIKLIVVLIVLGGVAATVSWQWPRISGFYQAVTQRSAKQPTQTSHDTPSAQPKFSGRVPQDQSSNPAPGTAAPVGPVAPAVAQRVVLYEEDPNDPQGRRFVGSAIWRTETVSPGPGLAPELAVRADVEIPERRMTVTWSLRRNTDQALPASHTIEIMFNLPADFPGGGVANVPGILMKQSEQARGTPLAGLAVKVTNGFFLIGLSAVDADVARNVQLLKERPWFDIPVVYTNGGRAILAMEKGPPGDRAFADAFAAWEKK
jgi:hypothetical protein